MQQHFFDEVFKCLPSGSTTKKPFKPSCPHDNVCCDEGDKKICLDCGELLQESYTLTINYNSGFCMTNRKTTDPSIYTGIPDFVDRDLKELTIKIYEVVTGKKHFRNKTKKSILLACLHRASVLKQSPISYYELLDMYKLKQHEANYGFIVLSSNIPKDSEYFIVFDQTREEIIGINSKLKQLKIEDPDSFLFRAVVNTFLLLKNNSNSVNNSQYTSVIYGCIYFWIVHYLDKNIDIDSFAKRAKISKTTLLKNYINVSDIVFKYILKAVFSELLKNCVEFQIEKPNAHKNKFLKKNVNISDLEYYNPDEECIIRNPFDVINITCEIRGNILPLDSVNDILEWNLLLNKCYYTSTTIRMLNVSLNLCPKDIYFDFSKYDTQFNIQNDKKRVGYNDKIKKGNEILKEVLISRFNGDVNQMKKNLKENVDVES